MNSKIEVTGSAYASFKPEAVRLVITMKGCDSDYAAVTALSAKEQQTLRACLDGAGLKEQDIVTTSFTVDTKYETRRFENDDYRHVLVGYEYRHDVYVSFDANDKSLEKALYALSASGISPEYRLEYALKNPSLERKKLLHAAVRDAYDKASCIAEAAGGKIIAVESITATGDSSDFTAPSGRAMLCADGAVPEINPNGITLCESVKAVFSFSVPCEG